MALMPHDQICLDSCDRTDVECGSYEARGCAYLVATRDKKHLRNYMPAHYKQNCSGVAEIPLWRQSDAMTTFCQSVASYTEDWIDRERAIYRRSGI